MELRSKQVDLSRQLSSAAQTLQMHEREVKRSDLTLSELSTLPGDVRAFAGVGRMYDVVGVCQTNFLAGSF